MGVASAMVGARVKRREDPRLITGNASYTDDIQPVGQLHMMFVRSPYAHANIKSIKIDAAKAVKGVKAIITGEDMLSAANPLPAFVPGPEYRAISVNKVCYVGDIVAAVIAETRGAARDAVDLVEVDYEELPAVVDVEKAAKGEPTLVHSQFANNLGLPMEFGNDVTDAFANAEVVIEQKFVHQRLGPNPMEPRTVLAEWRKGDETLTIHSSNQNPHLLRVWLSVVLNVPEQMIRVVAPEVGGGFGTKITIYREEVVACYAAKKLNKPIKWQETRSEHLVASSQGRGQVDYVRISATKDGVVTGLDIKAVADLGAYYTIFTPAIPQFTALVINGVYAIPNAHYKSANTLTNKTPTDAYRGAGRPEAAYMIERMMDLLAHELNMDPGDVRKKNFIPTDKFPYSSPMGLVYDTGDYAVNLDKALELFDYAGMRKQQAEAAAQGRHIGIGISTYMEICGLGPSVAVGGRGWDSATIRFEPTGKVTVYTGVSPHGQGQETTFSQIVADELGVPFEDIIVKHGDTQNTAVGNGTYGSRGLAVGGAALKLATESIIEKAKKIAGFLLEASGDDVEFVNGAFSVKGASGGKSVNMTEVGAAAYGNAGMFSAAGGNMEPGLEATRFFEPPNLVFPFGTHICAVEIDQETGELKFLKYVAVDDCGKQISPLLVEGQVHGGIAQGIGQALYEEIVHDENGQLISGTLMDYTVPTATELPYYTLDSTVTPTWVNPLGAKGVGEAGTIGSTPAVVNAVMDAMWHAGKKNIKEIDMPLRPEKLWKALNS
jgi:aerobic carbon-monoxide dehydrogenase large subunit